MSIDVILFASPKIVNVNLYWSGNWAVLNGWICPSGIPRLWRESGETLKSVTLHASPVRYISFCILSLIWIVTHQ